MAAHFPMPFGHSARFVLENGTSHPLPVAWNADVVRKPFALHREGYFHAFWSQEITERGKAHPWAHIAGQRGKFVGIVQTMAGRHGLGFLEGDDQFRIDGERWTPARSDLPTVIAPWNGTGTEDCFNSGWYFDAGTNSLPLNGLLVKKDEPGAIDCFRWFLNDAPIFQSSLDAQIEHGGVNEMPGIYYSSVSYWYSDGPAQPWATMPPPGDIVLPRPLPPRVKLARAIEGEACVASARATAGTVTIQDMAPFGANWSDDGQLWWFGAGPHDTLTLSLTPPAAGAYDLVVYLTRAPDYGQVAFALDGKPLGGTFDGYAGSVQPSGPVDLGPVTLPIGTSQLKITIAGKNPGSSNYLFGLDALVLNAPGSPAQQIPPMSLSGQ
jgi:hypothetical protein